MDITYPLAVALCWLLIGVVVIVALAALGAAENEHRATRPLVILLIVTFLGAIFFAAYLLARGAW